MSAGDSRVQPTVPACAIALFLLSACASVDLEQTMTQANADTLGFTQGKLQLATDQSQHQARLAEANRLLAQALSQEAAVELALINSPELQALIAESWAGMSIAAQSGRIPNPLFAFSRTRSGPELDLERTLSIGLLDLLTLPQRASMAQDRIKQHQLRLASDVIDHVTRVRMGWVNAVAARQALFYARQVLASAQASAELARRMQAVGNFSALARARQQAFYADAATQLAGAENVAVSTHENLVRLLGLSDTQAARLKLPERLPDLPATPRQANEISSVAGVARMDVRIAQAEFSAAAAAQGLKTVNSFTDIEIAAHRETMFDNSTGSKTTARGTELSIRLPIFDWGDAQRSAMTAQTLLLANRLAATLRSAGSHLRQSFFAYQTSYDVAKHYRDEIIPLHKMIADENLLRYNGMLIGVFELLADSRGQINTVIAAITAEQQFWLADAALAAAITGRPTESSLRLPTTSGSTDNDGKH